MPGLNCCDRCRSAIPRPAAVLRIASTPGVGPRLSPTTLCGDCASQLARWLAGGPPTLPDLEPASAGPETDPTPHRRIHR